MKLRLKTDGLTGEQLNFVNTLNTKFADMPETATADEVQSAVNSKFEELTGEKGLFKIALDAAIKTVTDDTVEGSLANIVKRQGVIIAGLQEHGTGGNQQQKSLVEVLEAMKDHFQDQAKSKNGSTIFELEFQRSTKGMTIKLAGGKDSLRIKAAATETVSGSITNSITTATGLRLGDGPFYEIKRNRFFLTDFINVGETNQAYLIWWDEAPAKQGDFAITAEGVMKPQVEYEFTRKSSDYKKIAGYMVITDEFYMDMPQLVTQIRRLAQIDIMNDLQTNVVTDMIAALPGFTYTGLNGKIYHADDYAAIGAAITQIQSLFFQPTVIALNPADHWKMRLTKDDVGRYQMPPFAFNGETFEFGTVITNPAIPLGTFLVGDGETYNLDFRGGLTIRIGYNGTDFVQNQQTLVVEQYYFDYISSNRIGAWVYGNFSVIKGVINDTTNS